MPLGDAHKTLLLGGSVLRAARPLEDSFFDTRNLQNDGLIIVPNLVTYPDSIHCFRWTAKIVWETAAKLGVPTDHTAASAVGSSGFFCSFAPAAGVLVKPSICTDLPNKDRGIKHWNRISALMWSCNVPVNRLAASRQHEPCCHTICNPFEWIQTCADLDSTTFALLLPFSAAGSCKCRPVEFTRSCTAWGDTTDNSAKQSGWTWSQSHTIAYTKRECLWLWEQNISRTSRVLQIRSLFQETHLTALSNLVPALSTTTKQTNHHLCMIWSWFHGWESLNPCQIQKRTDFFCCQSSMRGEIQQWSEILTHGNWACNKVPHPHDEFILSTCSFWGSHRGLHSEPQRDRNGALSPSDPELADIYQHVWKWNVSPKTDCVSAWKLNV